MGETLFGTTKKAAKLAVYDETMINVKNHLWHVQTINDIVLAAINFLI